MAKLFSMSSMKHVFFKKQRPTHRYIFGKYIFWKTFTVVLSFYFLGNKMGGDLLYVSAKNNCYIKRES